MTDETEKAFEPIEPVIVYACRFTRSLLRTAAPHHLIEIKAAISAVCQEWLEVEESVATNVINLDNGLELSFQAEPYEDGMSCTAHLYKEGAYELNCQTMLIKSVPETMAQAAITGQTKLEQYISEDLAKGLSIVSVIYRGLIYRDGEKINDLTSHSSNPPWDKDTSLSISFADDEGFAPISVQFEGEVCNVTHCHLTDYFFAKGSEDFRRRYLHVLIFGQSDINDIGLSSYNVDGTDIAVNGKMTIDGLEIQTIVGRIREYYLHSDNVRILNAPESVMAINHVGKRLSDFMDAPYPPSDCLITNQSREGSVLRFEFDPEQSQTLPSAEAA